MKSKTRIALAAAAIIALPLSAHAADARLPLKAPPAAPADSWYGFYFGANAGIGIARNRTNDTGTFEVPSIPVVAVPFNESLYHSPFGAIAGGQFGFNMRIQPRILIGIETDFQWSGQKDSTCVFGCGTSSTGFFNLGGPGDQTQVHISQKLNWFGTVRARVGYLHNDTLWYATGGGAYGRIGENISYDTSFIPGPPNPYPPGPQQGSFNRTRLGWTAGAGVESHLWGNWSVKAEYLYVDLGRIDDTFVISAPLFAIPALPSTFSIATSSRFTDHIVRVGVNYRFGVLPQLMP